MTIHIIMAALIAFVLVRTVVGIVSRIRRRKRPVGDKGWRMRFYGWFLVRAWGLAALVPVVALTTPALSAADLGWVLPHGRFGIDYAAAAAVVAAVVVAGLLVRRDMRRGEAVPGRDGTAALVPSSTRERWMAVAVALTAGVTEEALFRGLLIGAGTRVYHLPLAVAAVVSLALFVAGHAYQGRQALPGVAVVATLLTGIYLYSGSLLLPMLVHAGQDLVALLIVPAAPSTSAGQARVEPAEVPVNANAELAAVPAPEDAGQGVTRQNG